MRLHLLLAGLLILQEVRGQRSYWRRRGERLRSRARRYQRHHRERGDSYEGDNLRLSSRDLAKRVNKFERSERRYYPDSNNTTRVLQDTPEYRVQTRGGDTIIEFARSGEAQGKSFPDCEISDG